MDANHGHNGKFPPHLGDPMPSQFGLTNEGHGCSGWAYHGSHALPQNFETVETSKLRSTVANLEFRLAAKQREHSEAQTVINYLLKSNANAASLGGSCCTCKAVGLLHNKDLAHTEGEIRDILRVVLSILRKTSNAEIISHDTVQYDKARTTLAIGDLLGLEDEQPLSQLLGAEEAGFPKYTSVSSKVGHGKKLKGPFGQDGMENDSNQAEDLLSFDIDRFLQASDVARSSHDQDQAAHRAAVPTNVQLESNVEYSFEGLKSLQYHKHESDSGLSGTTQHDVSIATTTSTISPSTSFHSSDGQHEDSSSLEDESQPNSNAIPEDGPLGSAILSCNKYEGRLVTASAAAKKTTLFQFPHRGLRSDVAALFMPKWQVFPYTMDKEERAFAITDHHRLARDKKSLPAFFKFGIRFHPSSVMEDSFRTVIIDNLPPNLSVSTLLLQVRGGAVMDAQLLNTTSIHGRSSALITFVRERAARIFEERARTMSLHFAGIRARVVLLPTPTWPMPYDLQASILQHGHTRCIEVHNFPQNLSPSALEQNLHMCPSITPNRIERSELRSNNILELHFTSIKYAAIARAIISQQTGPYQ
ncbi:MAG: hypothetical protein Q9200_004082, partial [Gallowayella weberi]